MFGYVKKQIEEVRESLVLAAEKSLRSIDDVKLLAVSKTFPIEAIVAAYESKQRLFGENRVQELVNKKDSLPKDIEWHLFGHLQSNKVAKAVDASYLIHSVDSEKLVARIDRIACENRKIQKILLEINISGEKSKFGEDRDGALKFAEFAINSPNIELDGLMTMAPFGASEKELHYCFGTLRELKEKIESTFSVKLPELSMGMSSDYKVAIEEGATIVRIGTGIFGKRERKI